MRASAAAEKSGCRAVGIISTAFMKQSRVIARALGMPDLAVAEYPGNVSLDDEETFLRKVEGLVPQIVQGLSSPNLPGERPEEPRLRDVVYEGTLDEVQEFYHSRQWTDGLPIVPPTAERIERFLEFTDRSPEERIGILPPERREATVWNVAVNGVMAGCRPEYMPILLGIVEAIADPAYRLEDAGSTSGGEPVVVLNGPLIKELDFNYGQGVARVGRRANTSVGRFLRLYMRNVAGFRIPPGETDKACIGAGFNVALAENEEAVAALGWKSFAAEQGLSNGNVVSVMNVRSVSPPIYSAGTAAANHLRKFTDVWGKGTWLWSAYQGPRSLKMNGILAMPPIVAKVIAGEGLTKRDVGRYLYDNAWMTAGVMEQSARDDGGNTGFDLCAFVEQGLIPSEYCRSHDPDRLVRIFWKPEELGIVVTGDPLRNLSRGYMGGGKSGATTSKEIRLPHKWHQLRQKPDLPAQ